MGYGRDLGRCDHCGAKVLADQPHRAQCPTLTIERLRADLAAAEAEVAALRGHAERMANRIETVVPYVVATLPDRGADIERGDWPGAHRGRSSSSIHQLSILRSDAAAYRAHQATTPEPVEG
jgi:hypothetical protein